MPRPAGPVQSSSGSPDKVAGGDDRESASGSAQLRREGPGKGPEKSQCEWSRTLSPVCAQGLSLFYEFWVPSTDTCVDIVFSTNQPFIHGRFFFFFKELYERRMIFLLGIYCRYII